MPSLPLAAMLAPTPAHGSKSSTSIVQLSPEVSVRVKVLEPPDPGGGRGGEGGSIRLKSEYDDVLVAARALGKPPLEVARIAERDAEQLVAQSKERS